MNASVEFLQNQGLENFFKILPNKTKINLYFKNLCEKLDIKLHKRKAIENLVIYELTDGSRTSTSIRGPVQYLEGGLFALRLFHFLFLLGAKNGYVLTTGISHRLRDNYKEIMKGLELAIPLFKKYINYFPVRLKFIGDWVNKPFASKLKSLEEYSELKSWNSTLYILIDYSTNWALRSKQFKKLPNANVIIKHTKGQINEGLWLPDKLHNNAFVYVQNGSVSVNWTDKELVSLIVLSLRAYLFHENQQYTKSYKDGEREKIRIKREENLEMIHRQLNTPPTKRVLIFSNISPEIYEF